MRKLLFLIIVGVGTILAATSVPANALLFNLNVEYSGGTEPQGPRPWLTATFEDMGTSQVRLTMDTDGLIDSEFVSGWYFNLNFVGDVSADFVAAESTSPLAFVFFDADTSVPPNLNADGALGAGFNILFDFPTASATRFEENEIAVYDFFGDGLTASAFNALNAAGNFVSAAHVQAINDTIFPDDDSGWIGATAAIPEPGTILLLGAGLASLFGIRRFKFKKN
jgi:hypothetical protein